MITKDSMKFSLYYELVDKGGEKRNKYVGIQFGSVKDLEKWDSRYSLYTQKTDPLHSISEAREFLYPRHGHKDRLYFDNQVRFLSEFHQEQESAFHRLKKEMIRKRKEEEAALAESYRQEARESFNLNLAVYKQRLKHKVVNIQHRPINPDVRRRLDSLRQMVQQQYGGIFWRDEQ